MKGYKIVNFEGEPFINYIFLEEAVAKRVIEYCIENSIVQRLFLKIHPIDITVKDNNIFEKTTDSVSRYIMIPTSYTSKLKQVKLLKRCLNIPLIDIISKINTANTKGYMFTEYEIEKIINTVGWDCFIKESNQNGYNITEAQ